jgi:DNA-binding response OmpR family regulator
MASTILLVEDDESLSAVLRKRLAAAGYEVVQAGDGPSAVQAAHQARPRLILLDLMLPAGGGLFILEKLKSSSHTSTIPVIVITAMHDEDYKRRVLESGMEIAAYLQKPFRPEELLTVIQRRVGASGATQEGGSDA